MAIRIDAAADSLTRTAGLLDYNAAYTRAGFVYLLGANAYGVAVASYLDFDNRDIAGFGVDGQTLLAGGFNAGVGSEQSGATLDLNAWYFLGLRRQNATTLNAFAVRLSTLALSVTPNVAQSMTGRGANTGMQAGNGSAAGMLDTWINARLAGLKEWSAYLSDAELISEATQIMPVRWTNLHAWHPALPGTGRRRDYSGNVRDWTENGTLTDEDGPPLPAPWTGDDGLIAWAAPQGTNYNRTLSDHVVDVLDFTGTARFRNRFLSDAVALADALARREAKYTRRTSDTTDVTEVMHRFAKLYRTLTESGLDASDLLGRQVNVVRVLADSLGVSDAAIRTLLASRALIDSAEPVDAVIRRAMLHRLLQDDVDITDELVVTLTVAAQAIGFILMQLFAQGAMTLRAAQPIAMALREAQSIVMRLGKNVN